MTLSADTPTGDTAAPRGLSGRLLVSMPQLDDGPFAQSVVLVCQHDRDHAFGLIVNKPINGLFASDAVAEVRLDPRITAEDAPVFFGGPCEPQRGLILHTDEYRSEETILFGAGFGVTATRDALERLHGDQLRPANSRLLAGHSGWSPGQLDEELRRNSWLDIPADPDFVFGSDPEDMWEAALAELGIAMSSLSALGADIDAGNRPLN